MKMDSRNLNENEKAVKTKRDSRSHTNVLVPVVAPFVAVVWHWM